ncbi:VOC family protein [Brevibacillus thermoruber]|jgi:catechol 2,3-dioxygenase-like lactoylglutathione lyase family enzyme|uniref:VOC family protein n=1 Tax=Brevibacillus thermoruber TaxID=33942 RepID=A0A9X3TM43_9BACL|nr:VOC family protein [Brevibacillus thermoruber]MDA5106979.1 VOC family protein [Brevibacillus thermoruber]
MSHRWIGLDHVQVAAPAGCEEEARRFFRDVLGMPEVPKPEALRRRGGVWFQCGSQTVHVGVEASFAPAKKAHPAFLTSDLEALRQRLEAAGVTVREGDEIPGVKRFFADDPFGNRLEFMERIDS